MMPAVSSIQQANAAQQLLQTQQTQQAQTIQAAQQANKPQNLQTLQPQAADQNAALPPANPVVGTHINTTA
jgi:hypothetical protein